MADTLEVRIAHLEGAYEQIDKRLAELRQETTQQFAQVRQEIAQLRQDTNQQFTHLRQEMREQFRWILGFQILTWVSILGTLLAFLFRR